MDKKSNKNPSIASWGKSPLLKAYQKGKLTEFLKLISSGEDINCLDRYGEPLISIVLRNPNCLDNNRKFFDQLISSGVNLGHIDSSKGLLTTAVEKGVDIYYIKELLKNKLNVNSVGIYVPNNCIEDYMHRFNYGPPIFDALTTGNKSYIELFLKEGADINMLNFDDQSPLEYFVRYNYGTCEKLSEIFELLLDYGADSNVLNSNGETILHSIIITERYNLFDVLFKKVDDININTRNKFGITPLMLAVYAQNEYIVKFLIEKGANLDISNFNGNTSLLYAVNVNDKKIFELLVNSGANLYSCHKNWDGGTILHMIADLECKSDKNNLNSRKLNKFYKIILEKNPELLLIKNNSGKTAPDILKENNLYVGTKKRLFEKFENQKQFEN